MPGLRATAETDLGHILEDDTTGGGWPITLVAPSGVSAALVGFSSDISQLIDPLTGQAVSGRLATMALRVSTINDGLPGLGLPHGVTDADVKPWVVRFNDINGAEYTFKIVKSMPDRALGLLSCVLEVYSD